MSEGAPQDGDVATKIDAALDELYNLEQLVSAYDDGKQAAVQASFTHTARTLQAIEAAAPSLEGLDVPVKLLEWIDEGKDADAFYHTLMRECIGTAQAMKGKMSALATGQALLAAELSKADQELGGSNGPQATEGA